MYSILIMCTITTTIKSLVEIAIRSPGYSVVVVEQGKRFEMTDLRYARRSSGRRNKGLVECLSNGKLAIFDSSTVMMVED